MIKQCQQCSKDFKTYPALIKLGKGKYCSRECSNITDNLKVVAKCPICSKEFTTNQDRIKDGRGKFCSRPCYIEDWNKRIPGWNKGQSATWSIGNQHRKGIPNLSPNKMFAEENPQWKGDSVGYHGLHNWIRRKLGKPNYCEHCKNRTLNPRQYHWANKSHKYMRDVNDWIRLCVKCHKKYDC